MMKDMIVALVKEHWPAIQVALIAILTGAIANVVNAMMSSADANTSKFGRMLRWVLDRSPTFLSQKDAPGTLKMPFASSTSPKRVAKYKAMKERKAAAEATPPAPPAPPAA